MLSLTFKVSDSMMEPFKFDLIHETNHVMENQPFFKLDFFFQLNFSNVRCVEKEPFLMSQGAKTNVQVSDHTLRWLLASPA